MNIDKLMQVAAFILYEHDCKMLYLNLIKISYLADRKSYERIGHSMTGDTYFSFQYGPVLGNMLDLIYNRYKDTGAQNKWNAIFVTSDYDITIGFQNYPKDKLSRFEEKTLSDLCKKYKNFSYRQMIDEVHKKNVCPEWEAVPRHSKKRIHEKDILKALNFSDEEIKQTLLENKSYEKEASAVQKNQAISRNL